MEKSEEKLNKQISKYYVEHACQISSTGTVAAELGLEPSRISDLRGGRRQLTVSQAEKIKEIYGLPSTSQGHWMECELLSSIDLHKQFIDNGLALHFVQLIKMLNSEKFVNYIVDFCYFSDQSVPGYQSTLGLYNNDYTNAQLKNDDIFREYKLKFFNELLACDLFQTYCNGENTVFDPEFFDNICKEINPNFGFRQSDNFTRIFKLLRFLRDLRGLILSNTYAHLASCNTSFLVGGEYKITEKSSPKKEYVVVGKVVWEVGTDNLLRLTNPIANDGLFGLQADEDCFHVLSSLNPPILRFCSLKLYYSEQYKYLLAVELYQDEHRLNPVRKLLIGIEDRQNIFSELLELFNYFQIETSWTIKHIKYAIALNGGYIPGAIYLD